MEILSRARRWVKINPLSAFIIISIGVHLLLIVLFSRREETPDLREDLIQFDLREPIPEERRQILPPDPPPEPAEELIAPEEPPLPPPAPAPPRPPAEIILPEVIEPREESEEPDRRPLPGYIASLQALIDREIEYPSPASRQRREGQVTVAFTLDRSGRLTSLTIAPGGESAFDPFNREAIRAVRRASPYFRPFPESVNDEELTFRLPIIFTLR
jgi:TonB family protein